MRSSARDPAVAGALAEAEELELVTRGRRTGREHVVRLRFAFGEGTLWLRTEPQSAPRPASATVVVRRRGSRPPHWYRNLEADPRCRVRVGGYELAGRFKPSGDPAAAVRRTVELWRKKYGAEWVADWYVDAGRLPVRIDLD